MNRAFNIQKLFLFPSIVLLLLVAIVPFLYMLFLSFQDYSMAIPEKDGSFIGFGNYITIFTNDTFYEVIKVSAYFIFLSLSVELFLGLLIAFILYDNLKNKIIIPIVSIPIMIAPITVGLIWLLLLQGEYGLVDYIFNKIGLFTESSLLANSKTALFAVILVDIWQWTPFFVLLFFAGLLSIPNEPVESAKMDGASKLRIFKDIQLPLMFPIVIVTILIRFIEAVKEFDKVYILTGGGPGNETELFSLLGWRINFRSWDIGLGSAYITVLYISILIIVFGFLKLTEFNNEETK